MGLVRGADEMKIAQHLEPVSKLGAGATGPNNSAKLDDPVAIALGSDTDSLGAGHERLRQRAGIVYGDAVTVRSVGGSED